MKFSCNKTGRLQRIGRHTRKGTGFQSNQAGLCLYFLLFLGIDMLGQINFLTVVFLEMKWTKKNSMADCKVGPSDAVQICFCFSERMRSYFATYCHSTTSYCALIKIKMKPCTKSSHCHLPAPLTSLRALFNHSHSPNYQSLDSFIFSFALPMADYISSFQSQFK